MRAHNDGGLRVAKKIRVFRNFSPSRKGRSAGARAYPQAGMQSAVAAGGVLPPREKRFSQVIHS